MSPRFLKREPALTSRKLSPRPSMPSITARLHTSNSGFHLGRSLETLHPCAEILIVDHQSHDETLRIAREYGARIVQSVVVPNPADAAPPPLGNSPAPPGFSASTGAGPWANPWPPVSMNSSSRRLPTPSDPEAYFCA